MTRAPDDVVRAYAGSPVMATLYQAALTEAGITSRMVGGELAGTLGSLLPAEVELWVHRSDLPGVKGVIERESQPVGGKNHDRPHHYFPHPTDDPKPKPPPHRKERYVNPDPGA